MITTRIASHISKHDVTCVDSRVKELSGKETIERMRGIPPALSTKSRVNRKGALPAVLLYGGPTKSLALPPWLRIYHGTND